MCGRELLALELRAAEIPVAGLPHNEDDGHCRFATVTALFAHRWPTLRPTAPGLLLLPGGRS